MQYHINKIPKLLKFICSWPKMHMTVLEAISMSSAEFHAKVSACVQDPDLEIPVEVLLGRMNKLVSPIDLASVIRYTFYYTTYLEEHPSIGQRSTQQQLVKHFLSSITDASLRITTSSLGRFPKTLQEAYANLQTAAASGDKDALKAEMSALAVRGAALTGASRADDLKADRKAPWLRQRNRAEGDRASVALLTGPKSTRTVFIPKACFQCQEGDHDLNHCDKRTASDGVPICLACGPSVKRHECWKSDLCVAKKNWESARTPRFTLAASPKQTAASARDDVDYKALYMRERAEKEVAVQALKVRREFKLLQTSNHIASSASASYKSPADVIINIDSGANNVFVNDKFVLDAAPVFKGHNRTVEVANGEAARHYVGNVCSNSTFCYGDSYECTFIHSTIYRRGYAKSRHF